MLACCISLLLIRFSNRRMYRKISMLVLRHHSATDVLRVAEVVGLQIRVAGVAWHDCWIGRYKLMFVSENRLMGRRDSTMPRMYLSRIVNGIQL